MGNSQQGSDYGGVFIRTEKPYYFAGEVVQGNVYLDVRKPGFPGSIVLMRISGKEKCRWEETRTVSESDGKGGSHSRTETDVYHGKNQFYCHKFALHTFQSRELPPGQYVFPFQFTLFGHLPGSFDEKGHNFQAKITYKVKGLVESYQKNFKPMKHNQEMIVREPLKTNLQALFGQMEVNAKVCCCLARGTSHIKCVFDKNNYLPGDTAYLWVDLDNSNCDLDIKRVQAVLTNNVELRSKCGRTKVISRTVSQQTIDGIPSRTTAIESNRKTMQVQLVDQNAQGGIKPSTTGQIVKSQYELSATAVLSGCTCCSSDPSVKVPITIVAPVPAVYNQPVYQPQDWNPQVYQPQLVTFTESNVYAKPDSQMGSNYNYPPPNMGQMQQPM